jgi:hypothetical protein
VSYNIRESHTTHPAHFGKNETDIKNKTTLLNIMTSLCKYPKCIRTTSKKLTTVCSYHPRYDNVDFSIHKLCTRCRTPILLSYTKARCTKCNESNKKSLQNKNKFGECTALKATSDVCGDKVKTINDYGFCIRHFNLAENQKGKIAEVNKGVSRCTSQYICKGYTRGVKAILPEGYNLTKCVHCRNQIRSESEQFYEDESMNVCIGITAKGNPCTNLFAYRQLRLCASHYKSMAKNENVKQDKDNGVNRCHSRRSCGIGMKEKAILPANSKYTHCDYCRATERAVCANKKETDDKQYKKLTKESLKKSNERQCKQCNTLKDNEEFLNSKNVYGDYCQQCREHRAEKERKRDRQGRNVSDNVKTTKKQWRENNPDKVKEYLAKHRASEKYINRQDKRNRVLREYRTNNPKKFQVYNERRKQDIEYKLSYYKRRAEKKSFDWSITDEYALQLFTEQCYYCNCFSISTINGIDRVDNDKGYIEDNVVSCCTECNMIKCETNIEEFLKKVEHIVVFHKIVKGDLYIFEHDAHKTYNEKMTSANTRGIHIDITKKQFNDVSKKPCYICGKKTNDVHHNGIDRIDNYKGYVLNNIASCCGNCNYMKGNLKLSYFVYKLLRIHARNEDYSKEDWKKIKIDVHLRFKEIVGKTLDASNEIHPRRKIKNVHLEKLIQDNKQYINKASLNVTICDLYKKVESKKITTKELVLGVQAFIEKSKKRKEEQVKHAYELSDEVKEMCKPHQSVGKFRKFVSELKRKVIDGDVSKADVSVTIQKYIDTKLNAVDKYQFSDEIQVLIKKYKKHGKFVKFKNRYRKKAVADNIGEHQQLIDFREYIDEHINI